MVESKYSAIEILQILNDFYNFQAVFDPEVDAGLVLTFATTISEWREICDLVEPRKLAKSYQDLFQLTSPTIQLEDLMLSSKNSLEVLCCYLSQHAVKQSISPILIMGQYCMTASIFKTLISNLKIRGVEVKNIRPSSKLAPLFLKHAAIFLEEINKLVPGSLSTFDYHNNWLVRAGHTFMMIFILSLIIIPFIWNFHWILLTPLFIGMTLTFIGIKFKPTKCVVGGYDTVRDLILGMQT